VVLCGCVCSILPPDNQYHSLFIIRFVNSTSLIPLTGLLSPPALDVQFNSAALTRLNSLGQPHRKSTTCMLGDIQAWRGVASHRYHRSVCHGRFGCNTERCRGVARRWMLPPFQIPPANSEGPMQYYICQACYLTCEVSCI
jgi:hypothetical protein